MGPEVSEVFDEQVFQAAARIWAETGVGNPARGDTFESVVATLRHGGLFLTLRVDQVILGVCWLTNDGRRLYLHHMAVEPAHQGKGFGRILVEHALVHAREFGLQVKLEVHRDNTRARRLYERCQFRPLGAYDILILREQR